MPLNGLSTKGAKSTGLQFCIVSSESDIGRWMAAQ